MGKQGEQEEVTQDMGTRMTAMRMMGHSKGKTRVIKGKALSSHHTSTAREE